MTSLALGFVATWLGWAGWAGIPAVGRVLHAQAGVGIERRVPAPPPRPAVVPDRPVQLARDMQQKQVSPPANTTGTQPVLIAESPMY